MKEEWKPVIGYSRLYEVSSLGRVRSLPRKGTDGRQLYGKMLSVRGTGPGGRPRVCLYKKGKRVWKLVYRLVLEAFKGPCPKGKEACHYPDHDVTNCRLDNLRWDTRYNNVWDMIEAGRQNPNRSSDGRFA